MVRNSMEGSDPTTGHEVPPTEKKKRVRYVSLPRLKVPLDSLFKPNAMRLMDRGEV